LFFLNISTHFIFKRQVCLKKNRILGHKAQFRFAPVSRKFSHNGSTDIENFKNTDVVHSPDIRV